MKFDKQFSLSLLCSFLFTCLVISVSNQTYAQEGDSIKIQLFGHDDLNLDNGKNKRIITSTNRMADRPEDMVQDVIIIDGDEIRKFGYATLVDVLKNIPGFRTSQPGNALEGETFLMRGLVGNDHTKILINGIPVKPEAVRGMPIASQLPIRHAERIEIVMGPSSSSYGSDAMAGVINIVLPEIDRPVFAWADVNLLTPKTTEFNLTLGGKVGKGKNILNYEIFASSNRSSDINLLIPDDSVRVSPGALSQWQEELFFGDSLGNPEIQDLTRESRLLGAYLKFRWFEISAMNMYRKEHSGLGSNPLEQSYHDPGLTFGENINSFSLKYNDVKKKRYMSKFAISALTYRTLTNSSYYGVANYMSSGKNFIYARSVDFNVEYSGVLEINKQMRLAIGTTADYSISHPFTTFLGKPYRDESTSFDLPPENEWLETGATQSPAVESVSSLDSTVYLQRYTRHNYGGYIHYSFKSKSGKFIGEVGTRIDYNSFNDLVFTPKAGIVYKPIPRLKIRAYYGTGYRAPRSYYMFNNYSEYYLKTVNQGEGLERDLLNRDRILAEELDGAELGIEWKARKDLKFSALGYFHYMQNKVMRERADSLPPDIVSGSDEEKKFRVRSGFFNGDSYSMLYSVLFTTQYKKQFGKVGIDLLLSYEYANGWEIVEEEDDVAGSDTRKTPGYRFVPEHSVKANLTISAFDFTLSLRNNVMGHYVTDVYRQNRAVLFQETDKFYYNMDILLHKKLFRQLSVFGGVYNVFNSVQSGIPNASISRTWTFNPQYGTVYKLGLTFKLN
jgi:outer membrane cobalamin receptor